MTRTRMPVDGTKSPFRYVVQKVIARNKRMSGSGFRSEDTNIVHVEPNRIDSEISFRKKPSAETFQSSMRCTLVAACLLGLFPVHGLAKPGAHSLRYRSCTAAGLMSLFTVVTLAWAAVLSLVHTGQSLMRATAGKSGGFANATAGGIFYTNAALAAYLLRGIAKRWPIVVDAWERHEWRVAPPPKVRRALQAVAVAVLLLAMVEHILSIVINIPDCRANIDFGNFSWSGCLEEYSLKSHAFIFASIPYSVPLGVFIFYISKVGTFAWNFQDLFLTLTCLALVIHFNHINKIITGIEPQTSTAAVWKRVREQYVECTNLAKDLSKLLSKLVLLSFCNNLYFICLQMLNGLAPTLQSPLNNAYFFGSFFFMVARLVLVTMTAAAIPLEAKKALPFLRCCPSSAYCDEVERLCYQLTHDEIALTGMDFFTVNRSFILGLAGAIATYEVVLLQFDTGQIPLPNAIDPSKSQ